ncbi:MAG: anti-sigma factor domain-containing protein [Alphaproteobacteria bacterium]
MSDASPDTPRDDDSLLAAEYVLRLLDPAEEAAVAARIAREPALAEEVAGWTTRLSGLDAEVPEVAPGAAVKTALLRRLFGQPARLPFWQRAGLWQGISLASLAVAGFFAFQSLEQFAPPAPAPLFVSEIVAEDQSLRLLAVYDSGAAELRLTRTAGTAAAGRVLELWAIAGEAAPVSLGVLPAGETVALPLPEALRGAVAGLVLAVSDEPPGGSPTGAPTGAVLAVGQVSAL